MPNLEATCNDKITYTDPDGVVRTSSRVIVAPYTSQNVGSIDIPDTTTSATAYNVPFGSIAKATLIDVQNLSGQELIVKINGSLAIYNLPDQGALKLAADAFPASTPLTALSVTTTATQSGPGTVSYKVFGDPV